MTNLFRRPANRFCVWIKGFGPVPLATCQDDKPVIEGLPPRRIGDVCRIQVEGKRRIAMLLPNEQGNTFLVDRGPA